MKLGLGLGLRSYQYVGSAAPTYTARTQAFLTATGITDGTIASALDTMDLALISAGLLPSGTGAGKLKAIYPMAGGTATTHKFNFVDPADTNAAYRLGFSGGWTHNSSGATPNGTNCYADTFFNDSALTYNDCSIGYYALTTSIAGTTAIMGCNWNSPPYNLLSKTSTNIFGYWMINGNSVNDAGNIKGLTSVNSLVNTVKNYKNGSPLTMAASPVNVKLNQTIHIGGVRGLLTNTSPCAWAYIGSGLTAGEHASLYTLVQAYQTTMGRQVI